MNLLEALRLAGMRCVRFLQASTSEMFGTSPPPQSEATPFHPRSPYGVSKLCAYYAVREGGGMQGGQKAGRAEGAEEGREDWS